VLLVVVQADVTFVPALQTEQFVQLVATVETFVMPVVASEKVLPAQALQTRSVVLVPTADRNVPAAQVVDHAVQLVETVVEPTMSVTPSEKELAAHGVHTLSAVAEAAVA
jgi:hypothetical protein